MFDRKPKQPEGPSLLDRIVKSGAQRVAILGLHPGAGTRTVLGYLVRDIHKRAWPIAVTSAPRLPLERDDEAASKPVTRLAIPEGAFLATSGGPSDRSEATLHRIETTPWSTPLGLVSIYKVARGGEVELHGPGDADSLKDVIGRLGEAAGGMVLVDGGWERRVFAAPGVTDAVVLVLAAGYSATPERSAAAARYLVETLSVPPCDESAREAWANTASKGAAALLDARGQSRGVLPPGLDDPVPALKSKLDEPVSTVVLPHGLNDDFMIPLVRSSLRCTLVVRDATRINVAPVYFKAWLKGRGRIHVVRPNKIVAVATNPINMSGPDSEPEAFRELVARRRQGRGLAALRTDDRDDARQQEPALPESPHGHADAQRRGEPLRRHLRE